MSIIHGPGGYQLAGYRRHTRPQSGRSHGHAVNVLLATLGNAMSPAASLITLPILAHTLGVSGRGIVAATTAPLLFGNAFAAAGLPEAMVFFVAKSRSSAPQLLRRLSLLSILSGIISSAGVILLAPVLSGGNHHLARYITLASLGIAPTLVVSVSRGLAIGLQEWPRVRREQLFSSVFSLVAIAGLAASGHLTVPLAIVVVALTPIIGGISYLRFLRLYTEPVDRRPLDNRKLFSYARRSWIGSASGVAVARLDQSLMTVLANSYELGLYAVAVGVSEIPLIISGAVSLMAFSTDAADRNDERLAMSSRVASSVCLLLAACLCAMAPVVYPFMFGPGFSKAIPTTIVLAIAVVAGMPGSVAGSALAARGRPGVRSAGLVCAALLNVTLLVTLVPSLGEMGAALATLAANLFGNIWCLSFLRKIYGVRPLSFYGFRRSDMRAVRRLVLTRLGRRPDLSTS